MRPPSVSTDANASASRDVTRPSGIGRIRVRAISVSDSRSMTWLNADAPPATSAVPMIIHSSRHTSWALPPAMT